MVSLLRASWEQNLIYTQLIKQQCTTLICYRFMLCPMEWGKCPDLIKNERPVYQTLRTVKTPVDEACTCITI
jgi:hypothetical protein